MQSLKRKTMLWEDAKRSAELERQRAAAARTGQVVRSTVDVYGEPTQLDQMFEEASDTAALTSDQEDSISVLDEDQANGLDHFLDGDGSDIEDIIDAGDLGLENSESDAGRWADYGEAAEETHTAHMEAIAALVGVDEAKSEASDAAEAAANAQTTADGKNARRRGKTEPPAPAGGWVQGDQWVVENDAGKPVAVRVWNGAAFVADQLLADELLILGEDGVIRLANGVVYAPALATDALDFKTARGMEILAGKIEGGTLALADLISETPTLTDNCESLTYWASLTIGGTKPVLSTIAHSGTYSVRVPATEGAMLTKGSASHSIDVVTFWVRSNVAQNIVISSYPGIGRKDAGSIPANQWTRIVVPIPRNEFWYLGIVGDADGLLYIDDVYCYTESLSAASGLRIFRDASGVAKLTSYGANGDRAALSAGELEFTNTGGAGKARLNAATVDGQSYGMLRLEGQTGGSEIGVIEIRTNGRNAHTSYYVDNYTGWVSLEADGTLAIGARDYLPGVGRSTPNVSFSAPVSFSTDRAWNPLTPIAPFALYSAGDASTLQVVRYGDWVQITGVLTCNTAGHISGTTARMLTVIPPGFRPDKWTRLRCQGSGSESWFLDMNPDGNVTAARYSGTQSAGVWLPIHAVYRAAP